MDIPLIYSPTKGYRPAYLGPCGYPTQQAEHNNEFFFYHSQSDFTKKKLLSRADIFLFKQSQTWHCLNIKLRIYFQSSVLELRKFEIINEWMNKQINK